METQLLYSWAKFHAMNNLEKRGLFSNLIIERLGLHCEAHIYRVLTRLTFQTLQQKYGECYQFTQDEVQFQKLLGELELPPSTILNWYYTTTKTTPLHLEKEECRGLSSASVCECCIPEEVKEKLKNNYEYRLVSKRLYQIMVRVELFKDLLVRNNILLTDDEMRISLRRIVEYDYYLRRRKKEYLLNETDIAIQNVLKEKGIRAITALRWCYLLRHHPELMKKVYQGDINPDEVFDQCAMKMMKTLRGGIDGSSNVCD